MSERTAPVPGTHLPQPAPRPGAAGSDLVADLRARLEALHESAAVAEQLPVLEGLVDELGRRLGEATA